MRLIGRVAGWVRRLVPELAKFGTIGVVAFVISDGGSNLLRFDAGLDVLSANAIATVAGVLFAFAGNRYWTFRQRKRSGVGREGVLFFVFNGVGLLIQLAVIGFTSYVLGLTGKLAYNVALIVGIGLGTLFRFWSYHRWVWGAQQEHEPPAGHSPPPQVPA